MNMGYVIVTICQPVWSAHLTQIKSICMESFLCRIQVNLKKKYVYIHKKWNKHI